MVIEPQAGEQVDQFDGPKHDDEREQQDRVVEKRVSLPIGFGFGHPAAKVLSIPRCRNLKILREPIGNRHPIRAEPNWAAALGACLLRCICLEVG